MRLNVLAGLAAAAIAAGSLAATEARALVVDFGYTGAAQSWTAPDGVFSIEIEVWGAAGYTAGANAGGEGGYSLGTLSVTPGEILWILVGGMGFSAGGDYTTPAGGGFNGGGDGRTNSTTTTYTGGGGGATDVRQGGDGVGDRVIVAGGGGGATQNSGSVGGDGGGLVGENGGSASGMFPGGVGGTQSTAGRNGGFGFGGSATLNETPWIGGGGGGWYGGGVALEHAGGAGGSSYIGGVTDGEALRGGNLGDGMARFTFDAAPVPLPAAGLLLAGGLGALGVLRRRKAA